LLENGRDPKNLTLVRINAYGQRIPMTLTSWNCKDGVIETDDFIKLNDSLYLSYTYEEEGYSYRGYTDEDLGDRLHLDLNPLQYHTTKVAFGGVVEEMPSYSLFNFTVHLWLQPVSRDLADDEENPVVDGSFIPPGKALYHTFHEADRKKASDLLISKILLRHNTTVDAMELRDTRSRGGGVRRKIPDSLRKALEPESEYYWDIGYWDGEPYSENGVTVVRLDRKILKDFGGRFDPKEVEVIVKRHLAYGVLPLIEYVGTYTKEDRPIPKVEGHYENIIHWTPVFDLTVYNTVQRPVSIIETEDREWPSCDIMEPTEVNMHNILLSAEIYETNHKIEFSDVIDGTIVRTPLFSPTGLIWTEEI